MKVVVYCRGVGTVARGWGRTDGVYLVHCAVGEGLGGGIRGSWWWLVRHSANVRKDVMSVRYRQWALIRAVRMVEGECESGRCGWSSGILIG